MEGGFADEAIVTDALDVKQTSVGRKADLAQLLEIFDASNPIDCQRKAGISTKGTSHGALTIEPLCKDEMRVGQKNKLTYRWARTGSRPRAVHDQRTQSTYLFGAVCPERGPASSCRSCNAEAMQFHLDDIAAKVAPRAHAILVFDQAGWHGAKALKTPPNLSLMPLPPRAPELNPQENIRQFMRANWLSNRVFKSHDDIVDHCCYAWNTLIDQPWKIMSSRSAQHAHRPRQARQTSLGRAERPCR